MARRDVVMALRRSAGPGSPRALNGLRPTGGHRRRQRRRPPSSIGAAPSARSPGRIVTPACRRPMLDEARRARDRRDRLAARHHLDVGRGRRGTGSHASAAARSPAAGRSSSSWWRRDPGRRRSRRCPDRRRRVLEAGRPGRARVATGAAATAAAHGSAKVLPALAGAARAADGRLRGRVAVDGPDVRVPADRGLRRRPGTGCWRRSAPSRPAATTRRTISRQLSVGCVASSSTPPWANYGGYSRAWLAPPRCRTPRLRSTPRRSCSATTVTSRRSR